MNEKDIAQTIKLGKDLEEVKRVQSELQGCKLDKARLEKNIVILKKANAEERQKYEADKQERKEQIAQLDSNIKVLEVKRANLATSIVPEVKRFENLKAEMDKKSANLERQQNALVEKSDALNKKGNALEDKKDILAQIIELTKKI